MFVGTPRPRAARSRSSARVERSGGDDPGAEAVAAGDEFAERGLDGHVAGGREDRVKRLTETSAFSAPEDAAPARPRRERAAVALVEDLEVAGDIGLEGELVEEALAEGMDGLDLEAAGGLQGPGEKPAGGRKLAESGAWPSSSAISLAQLRVGERGPVGRGWRRPAWPSRRRPPW